MQKSQTLNAETRYVESKMLASEKMRILCQKEIKNGSLNDGRVWAIYMGNHEQPLMPKDGVYSNIDWTYLAQSLPEQL